MVVTRSKVPVPRRSPRLSSATTTISKPDTNGKKKKKKMMNTKPKPITPLLWPDSGPVTEEYREKKIEHQIKHSFERRGEQFSYGPEYEKRTCILSRGDTFSWKEKCSKTSWVAVNGTETICVVAINTRGELQEHEEMLLCMKTGARRCPTTHLTTAKSLYEMIDSSGALRQRIGPSSETGPVAVVSVAPGTIQDHESGDESRQALDAINFLEAKLKHRPALTIPETVQIAVCALYYLFGPKFKSNAIEVRVSRGYVEHIGNLTSNTIEECKVEEFLATINEATSDHGS